MKIQFTYVFIFLCLICVGQSTDWNQLSAIQNNYYKIVFQSSNGSLIAEHTGDKNLYYSSDRNLYYSKDFGQHWQWIDFKIDNTFNTWRDIRNFSENKGKIYFSYYESIYEFDEENIKMNLYLSFPTPVSYFTFSKKNDIFVDLGFCITLYSEDKEFKNKYCLFSQKRKLLIGETRNYLIYTFDGTSSEMVTFKNGLEFVSEKLLGTGYSDKFLISGDRILVGNGYSDDGTETYHRYKNDGNEIEFEYVTKASDGIYATNSNVIYKSIDNGSNFSIYKTVDALKIDAIFSGNGSFVTTQSYLCDDNYAINSIDTKNEITMKSLADTGKPNAKKVYPGLDEHVYSTACSSHYSIYDPITKSWFAENIDNSSKRIAGLLNLKNGATLCMNYNMPNFIKSDNGANWIPLPSSKLTFVYDTSDYNVNYFNLYEKKSGIFIQSRGLDTLYSSQDNGYSWKGSRMSNVFNILGNYQSLTVSVIDKDNVYFDGWIEKSIYKLNLKTKEYKTVFTYNSSIVDHETSFDGRSIYLLLYDEISYSLQVSNDAGITYKEIKLNLNKVPNFSYQLYTDHLGHLFIFSKWNAYILNDDGVTFDEITPNDPNFFKINDIKVSYDNFNYMATDGLGIIKYKTQLKDLTSPSENIPLDHLIVFPNPTDNILKWNLPDRASHQSNTVDVYDLNGRNLKHFEDTLMRELDISNLLSGTYMLQIKSSNDSERSLFVKI